MGQANTDKNRNRRKSDQETWERTLDEISRQLCRPEDWEAQRLREAFYETRGVRDVKVFPLWRRYRWQAQKVAQLQQSLPLLKHLPFQVSAILGELLFK